MFERHVRFRPHVVALVASFLTAAPALSQELVQCDVVRSDHEGLATPSVRQSVAFQDGRVLRVVLIYTSDEVSETCYTPLRPGVSYRMAFFQSNRDAGVWRAVFNLATVEEDGTVLLESWFRQTDSSAPPRPISVRLRCEQKG